MADMLGPAYEYLAFFGKVNASVSHEIKNVLATISETSGLMGDLVEIAQDGGALDLARFSALCNRIVTQVQRGNGIIRNMNRFAHSVDTPLVRLDAVDMTRFLASLYERFAAIRGVTLSAGEADEAVLTTSPYGLAHLVFRLLMLSLEHAQKGDAISLNVVAESPSGVLLSLGPVRTPAEAVAAEAAGHHQVMSSRVALDPATGLIQIRLSDQQEGA